MEISGCKNVVTAGTNVSNMMVVLMTQCVNEKIQNLFNYDKLLLIGFDYSWKFEGKYYSFDEDGGGKKYYMRHIYGVSQSGKIIFTSNNLNSSASWLSLYLSTFKIKALQCSKDALFEFGGFGDLDKQMKYKYKTEDKGRFNNLLKERHGIEEKLNFINNKLKSIVKDHYYAAESF
jgi:hypothetical protein